jgi:hypothetical protein
MPSFYKKEQKMKIKSILAAFSSIALFMFFSTSNLSAATALKPRSMSRSKAPSIKLLSPNGGEKIRIGALHKIRWQTKGVGGNITIYITYKNRTLGTIARNIRASAGVYRWKVGHALKTRIKAADVYKIVLKTGNRKVFDQSDKYFSITSGRAKSIPTLTAPKTSVRKPAKRPSHRTTGRVSPAETGQKDSGGTTGQSDQQKEDTQPSQGSTPEASPYINVTEPVQYIGWCSDTPYAIKWDSNLPSSQNLKIELVSHGQTGFHVWKNISSNTANNGFYQFNGLSDSQIPVLSIALNVRVSTLDNAVSGISPFITIGKQLKLLVSQTYTSIWRQGSEYTIKWEQVCDLPAPLDIDLLDFNHQQALSIASALSPLATTFTTVKIKQHKWTVPSNLTPGTYYIRLSSGTITKEKPIKIDVPFAPPSSPEITITSPNQNEGWCSDNDHTIQWTSNLPSNTELKIDFVQSTSGGGFAVWRNITPGTLNSGSFTFTSPFTGAIVVRPKISTLDDATATIGDAFVYGAPLSLIQPNGLYPWRKGSNHSILWKQVCNLPGPVTIDLLDSGHQHVLTIASGLSAQAKTDLAKQYGYVWKIPMNLTPGTYYIRVTSGALSKERSFNIDEPAN